MTPEQISLVHTSWRNLFPHAVKFTKTFYDRLFEIDPELKFLFEKPMHQQLQKLFSALGLIVKELDNLDALTPVVRQLAVDYVKYGVKEKDYDSIGVALLWSLRQNLGEDFTKATKEAWIIAFTTLSSTMKTTAREAANKTD